MYNNPLLDKTDSIFVSIDLQKKILPAMCYKDIVVRNSNILIKAAGILDIPLIVTEQYPKGLGETDESISIDRNTVPIFDKTSFSIFGSDNFVSEIKKYKKNNLFIFGIETHVCVFQSVFHALKDNYKVYLIENACSSRNEIDHKIGIEAMRDLGAYIISTEMAIFQHLVASTDDKFRDLSSIIK